MKIPRSPWISLQTRFIITLGLLLLSVTALAVGEFLYLSLLGDAVRRQLFLLTVGVFGAGLVIAIGASVALVRSILDPLRALEQGADRLGEGEFSHRVAPTTSDELGQLTTAFNTMAEKLERSQAALKDLSIRDSLTGLYNNRELHARLKDEVERSRRYGGHFSLLLLDIDHFKSVNDTYGHQCGDKVLKAIAILVSENIRSVDKAARYGGDELGLIVPATQGPGAVAMAERICALIAAHAIPVAQGRAVNLTASIGVAVYPEDGGSEEELIAAVDQSLYAAKQAGRNRVYQSGRSKGGKRSRQRS